MSKPTTKEDALTPAQKQSLAGAVKRAYKVAEWDGNMRKRPDLWDYAHPTALALVRKGMVEEVTSQGYRTKFRLTKAGVEQGTAEATRLLGEHPQILAKREQDAKNKALNDRNKLIAVAVAPFRSFRVTQNGKKVPLGKLLEKQLRRENYNNSSTASLDLKQWQQLGEQIEGLIP